MSFKKSVLSAGISAVAAVLLAVFGGISWESNDDMGIAFVISRSAEGSSIFQQKWLVGVLNGLYSNNPGVNWWLIFTLAVMAISIFCTCYVLCRTKDELLALVLNAILVIVAYLYAARSINFTKTAAIAGAGGVALMYYAVFGGKTLRFLKYIVGILLFLISFAIRDTVGLMAVAYLAVAALVDFAYMWFIGKQRSIRSYVKPSILLLGAAGITIASIFVNRGMLNEQEKEYLQYNSARAAVQDYVEQYPKWEDAAEEYQSIGMSKNDVTAVMRWIHEDTEFLTTDRLQQLKTLKKGRSGIVEALKETIFFLMKQPGFLFISAVIAILSLFLVISDLRYNLFRTAAVVGFTCVTAFVLIWLGRLPERVIFSLAWLMLCSFLLTPSVFSTDDCVKNSSHIVNFLGKSVNVFMIIANSAVYGPLRPCCPVSPGTVSRSGCEQFAGQLYQ